MPNPSSPPMDRPALLAALRARVARQERAGADAAAENSLALAGTRAISLAPPIDAALPGGGGLPRAAVHEVLSPAAAPGAGGATGFAALLLGRAGGAVFWIGRDPDAWPPGLARFGLPPDRLLFVRAPAAADAFWVAEEALRCSAVGGVLLADDVPDPTAARRLQLAAETGGGIGLLLRQSPDGEDSGPVNATTRWRVSGHAGGGTARHDLGDPQWDLELLRCRGGRPGRWRVTWRAGEDELRPEDSGNEDTGNGVPEDESCGTAAAARR